MKLIKLNTDYYIIVDDSEIKEGDWYYNFDYNYIKMCVEVDREFIKNALFYEKGSTVFDYSKDCKKITHSTQPLGIKPITDKVVIEKDKDNNPLMSAQYVELDMSCTVKPLSLQEVKELIGEVDVEKKEIILTDSQKELLNIGNVSYKDSSIIYYLPYIFINQNGKWYMQFEDNKDKKYTEEDIYKAIQYGREVHYTNDQLFIQSLQPKTEWEVEIIDGKLKLK